MLAILFASLLPIAAIDPPPIPPATTVAVLPARAFASVFTSTAPTVSGSAVTAIPPRPVQKSKVICGMTVITVDGSIDPKFALAPKTQTEFPIGRVPKPMCGNPDGKN